MHGCPRSSLITVRLPLETLPPGRRNQAVRKIVEQAEANVLSAALQRIYVIERHSELTLEFWFQGCTQSEADLCVGAAIRDAIAVELDLSVPTPPVAEAAK